MSTTTGSCYFGDGSRIVRIVNAVKLKTQALGPRGALVAGLLLLGGCSHLQAMWPWHKQPPPPDPIVHELVVVTGEGADAPSVTQTWDRNALRVDLSGVTGAGELRLRPAQSHGWPIRLEFAVRSGAFAQLEVRGDERVVMSVPATGGVAVLPVPLGIYSAGTSELTLRF